MAEGIIISLCCYFFTFIILSIIRMWQFLKHLFLKYIKPFLTWRILVCYLPFWFIASGWAWLFSIIGTGWLRGIALGWLTFLWMPWCPEKLITIPLAIWLHKKLFPNHSVASLNEILEKEQADYKKRKIKRRKKDEN